MVQASALAAVSSPALSPGARPTAPALALSVVLHGALAGTALWWPLSGTDVSVPTVTVEVAFWPEAVGEETTAASAAPAEPLAPGEVTPEPPAEVPTQVAAVEPSPPPQPEPAPQTAEPAPLVVEQPPPPPPKPRERARVAPKPAPVERPVERAAPAPNEPALADPGQSLAALPSPHPPAATPAQPASLPAAMEMPSSPPPLITQARFRSPPLAPTYPRRAIDLGQEGEVLIRALVGPDGESRDIRIFRSSGVPLLDEAALRAVRRWAFEAAQINGRAIEAWVEVPVRFQLRTVL